MNGRMAQHFATHGDIERMRADVLERMGQLKVRLVGCMSALEVRLIERMEQNRTEMIERTEQAEKRTLRWVAGLFSAQPFVLVGAVLGMIEVLR